MILYHTQRNYTVPSGAVVGVGPVVILFTVVVSDGVWFAIALSSALCANSGGILFAVLLVKSLFDLSNFTIV